MPKGLLTTTKMLGEHSSGLMYAHYYCLRWRQPRRIDLFKCIKSIVERLVW